MSIHKDKKRNTWYVKYSNKTKRGFASKKDAQEYEASLMSGLIEVKAKDEKHLFSIVVQDFLKNKKREVSYTSYSAYKQIVEQIIIPQFKSYYIEDIKEIDCRKFRDYVQDLKCCSHRKNRVFNLLKAIFDHASVYFKITTNPTVVIKPVNAKYEEKILRKSKQLNIWSNEEFKSFIVFVHDEEYKSLYITLFYTGMRLGEALALNWNDLSQNNISITKSNSKVCETNSYVIKHPKNVSSIRDIRINDSLYDYLTNKEKEEMKKPDFSYSWFMFGGVEPLSRTSIERVKNNAVKLSGVKKIRIHDFRHSHASILIGEGVDIVAVSKRLGHKDVATTLQVYTHLLVKNEDKLVGFLENSSHNLLTTFSQMNKVDTKLIKDDTLE